MMRYQPPVPDYTSLSSGYGPRTNAGVHQEAGGHPGLDYPMPVGTTVTAAADGIVERASEVKGYGLTVVVGHADGYHSLYGHLSSVNVQVGEQLRQEEAIGKSGVGGTGPHLHFSVLHNVAIPEQGPLGFKVNIGNTINPTELYASSLIDQAIEVARSIWDKMCEIVAGAETGAAPVKVAPLGKAHGGAKHSEPTHASGTPIPPISTDDSYEEWSLPEVEPGNSPAYAPDGPDHKNDEHFENAPLSHDGHFEPHEADLGTAYHHASGDHFDHMETTHDRHSEGSGRGSDSDHHHHHYQHNDSSDSHRSSLHGSGSDHASWSHSNF